MVVKLLAILYMDQDARRIHTTARSRAPVRSADFLIHEDHQGHEYRFCLHFTNLRDLRDLRGSAYVTGLWVLSRLARPSGGGLGRLAHLPHTRWRAEGA